MVVAEAGYARRRVADSAWLLVDRFPIASKSEPNWRYTDTLALNTSAVKRS
jgi:hypothetical protein